MEERELVIEPDITQAKHRAGLVDVPSEGLPAGGQSAAGLSVEVKTRHAVRLAGVEALETKDNVRPFAAGERRLIDRDQRFVGHQNLLPLAVVRVPDLEVRVDTQPEGDARGPLF